jgi:hypothetical protein
MKESIETEAEGRSKRGIPRLLIIVVVVSLVLLLWASSFYVVMAALRLGVPAGNLPSLGDMATLLFGASSLALILFSLLIGGVAIIGWQSLKQDVRKEIEAATHERINALELELRGRVLAAIGLMLGVLHSSPDRLEQDGQGGYLSEAVQHCEEAYKLLKGLKGNAKYMALNNFVYYSCLSGDTEKRDYLLAQAQVLKRVGQEKDYLEALLTYCRTILQFGTRTEELSDAHSMATALLRRDLTERQKKEVTFYVTSLAKKLPAKSTTTKSS